jgi:hypothetical protein
VRPSFEGWQRDFVGFCVRCHSPATKTIWFTRKDFGCIKVCIWAVKTEIVRIAPILGRP